MTTTPTHTRRARTSDAARIAALIGQHVATGELEPRTPEYVAERALEFLVAEETPGGRVIGCVHLTEYSPSLAEIRSLAVDASHQHRGIGAALLRAVEALATRLDYPTVFSVSNDETYCLRHGYARREIPELRPEHSEVSRYRGVFAKDLIPAATSPRAAPERSPRAAQ
jgi:amino-acid N-acetyltransferase